MTEAQRRAAAKYDRNNTRIYTIKLNVNTDQELIKVIEDQGNVQGFIKGLIRDYIKDININA